MDSLWQNFKLAARLGKPQEIPVALIVDSPWLPGYANIDTRDYYLFPDKWLKINKSLFTRFPGIVWIPGFWVEYGMAIEPSAFGGIRLRIHPDSPPDIEPLVPDIDFWAKTEPINPEEDGLMPLALRMYEVMETRLRAEGLGIKMVCARGPMVLASWQVGITPLMMALISNPDSVSKVLETMSTSIIRWLNAQLAVLKDPEGIMLLDDVVGMVSLPHYEELIAPHLKRIFSEFDGLIRIYHNDTPCIQLYAALSEANFEVFNFSHEVNIREARALMGHRVALMGNVPPLDVGVRGTPDDVYRAAQKCLEEGGGYDGIILSFGGGVSPGTPAENIDMLTKAVQDYQSAPK